MPHILGYRVWYLSYFIIQLKRIYNFIGNKVKWVREMVWGPRIFEYSGSLIVQYQWPEGLRRGALLHTHVRNEFCAWWLFNWIHSLRNALAWEHVKREKIEKSCTILTQKLKKCMGQTRMELAPCLVFLKGLHRN